ncbi:piggyBac transposable element-derived protein 4-like [Uloborus diversus]|uniref:piggyBac transposable element-derived protein 4-like n=1 Tax=Uloborus diversus TaxID=327109 RepID=UPI00240A2DA4|nr:piggyBac transposable element-derived protein 4-like [Uloborus diversus]
MSDADYSSNDSSDYSIYSDDEESSDEENSADDNLANVRGWCKIDVSNCPPAPPRFSFQEKPGLTFDVVDGENPLEYFLKFFDDEILNFIVKETNEFADDFLINANITPRSRCLSWKELTKEELQLFLALNILMGVNPKPKIEMYWSKDPLIESPFFRCYNLERDICIDESLLLYKGRLAWKQYMPKKRARFGIKFFMLCESSSGYIANAIIYIGKDTDFDTTYMNYGFSTKCVMTLMETLLNKGHCLIMDNFYNSPELTELLIQNKTDVYGTLRCNRKDLPTGFKSEKIRENDVIAYQKGKMLVLKWMDKRAVSMISTIHSAQMTDVIPKAYEQQVLKKKPSTVVDYNKTMGGVDKMDSCTSNYSAKRKRQKKYYKKIFFHLLDLTIWNSFILYKKNDGSLDHLGFRMKLVRNIVERCASNTSRKSTSSKKIENPLRFTGQHFPHKIPATEKKAEPTRCCVICSSKKKDNGKKIRRETRYHCPKCEVGLCPAPCFEIFHTKDDEE